MEETNIEIGYKINALKYEILELYIRIPSNAGDLYSLPYKNYLHPLMPVVLD